MTIHHLLEAELEIYRVDGDEILIVALAHTSRHPEYWRHR